MAGIEKLQAAQTSEDFAKIIGYKTKGLSYILYHMTDKQKYKEFSIPKKSGGHRTIRAPRKELKLLQKRVSNILYLILEENESKDRQYKSISHGFSKDHSIITNALCHKRKRYVFNLDLSDFFDTINFGRVRGVLINDQKLSLHPNIATILAQIACHKNALPQGSPCSPVLSNIVGRLLDVRLVRLARKFKCTYSRYADDITFSTNQMKFPAGLACPDPTSPGKWVIGSKLSKEILKAGFNVNTNKTRMQFRTSRQTVTGLVTNTKVNICSDYYRTVRAMCHTFFSTGSYYRTMQATLVGGQATDPNVKVEIKSPACLEGMLGYVYFVKNRIDQRDGVTKKKEPSAIRLLYHRFLFYKHFVILKSATIITEGKTDPIYLKSAIERQKIFHPKLGVVENKKFKLTVKFLNFTNVIHDVLQLGRGVEDIKFFIKDYGDIVSEYKNSLIRHPVIILIDNDEGTKEVFSMMRQKYPQHKDISTESFDNFYHLCLNLYLVKTPETGKKKGMTCIEDFFDQSVLDTKVDNKTFDPNKKHNENGKYGKHIFAEKVIRPNKENIDFSKFDTILERVSAVIDDYSTRILGK